MKKIFLIVASLVLIAGIIFWRFTTADYHFAYSSKSPDGNYVLEVYKQNIRVAMPGQGGDAMAKLVLKDSSGKTLGTVTADNADCSIMFRDIEIEWEMPEKRVSYGVARSIDLQTGSCND